MNLDRYNYLNGSTPNRFSFESVGPKGIIIKLIEFEAMPDFFLPDIGAVMNLSFGDLKVDGSVDDKVISNNRDRDKILATVAAVIVEYTNKYGKVHVHAKGETPMKTRLYQMGINANLKEIESIFYVMGYLNDGWVTFRPGINYSAFLVLRKLI
jgi:hypothetical protein